MNKNTERKEVFKMDYEKQRRQRRVEWIKRWKLLLYGPCFGLLAIVFFSGPSIVQEWPTFKIMDKVLILILCLLVVTVLIVAALIWRSSDREQKELQKELLKEGGTIE